MKLIEHTRLTARLTAAALASPPAQRPAKHFHASALADCLRQQGYALLGHVGESRFDPDYALAARQGDLIHEALQAQMRGAGMVLDLPTGPAIEASLADYATPDLARYHLSGRIDAVLIQQNGELAILDVKTVAGKALNGPYWHEKLEHYKTQVQAYLHFFRAPDGRTARVGFVYVVAREDTKTRLLYQVDYDVEYMAGHLARLAAAVDAVRAGELPEPEPARGPCRWCAYRALCPAGGTKYSV